MMKGTFFNMDGTQEPVEVDVLNGPGAPCPGMNRVTFLKTSHFAWTDEFLLTAKMSKGTREAVTAAFHALPDPYQRLFLKPLGSKQARIERFSWWEGILQGLPEQQRKEALDVFRQHFFPDRGKWREEKSIKKGT